MVAAGLSGPARASVGAVRDYRARRSTLVNGRGELLTLRRPGHEERGRLRRVARCWPASLGTLGVITEVSLKVLPVAPAEATLKFAMQRRPRRCDRLNAWGGQPLPLNASCWVDDGGPGRCTCACAARSRRWRPPADTWAASARTTPRSRPTGRCAATSACPGSRQRGAARPVAPVGAADRAGAGLCRSRRWSNGTAASAGCAPAARTAQRVREAARAVGGHATLFRAGGDGRRTPAALRRRCSRRWTASTANSSASSIPAGIFNRGRLLPRLLTPRCKPNSLPNSRARADGREAEAILRKCVHCGFCTATCPTYQLLGDELDGPRGRIYLIKQVLEGEAPTRSTQLHLDRCLTCRNCESTCPERRAVRPPGRHRPQDRGREGAARRRLEGAALGAEGRPALAAVRPGDEAGPGGARPAARGAQGQGAGQRRTPAPGPRARMRARC